MEDVTNVMDSPREQNSFLPTADSLAGCQRIQVVYFCTAKCHQETSNIKF